METSIIGYLASRRSRDLVTAANQQMTHEWWDTRRQQYELFIAQPVIDECSAGDPIAAQERLAYLKDLIMLPVVEQVLSISKRLLVEVPLPPKANVDALHLAAAAVHRLDFLLTWNCTHIANADFRRRIEIVCASEGLKIPIICTPQEFLGSKTC